jgi:protein TonB
MKEKINRIIKNNLFGTMLFLSVFLHFSVYAAYYISTIIESQEVDSDSIKQDVDVNFEEIPPELIGGTSSPAPVEKQEWVEGKNKNGDDPIDDDINVNAVSGNGTDKDGYLFSFNGDKVPTPIIDFDLKQFFPAAAKAANITEKTVVILVQIDETGQLKSAKIASGKAGYGFDEEG